MTFDQWLENLIANGGGVVASDPLEFGRIVWNAATHSAADTCIRHGIEPEVMIITRLDESARENFAREFAAAIRQTLTDP